MIAPGQERSLSPDPTRLGIEAEAMVALGRLDGALHLAQAATLRLFAARLLRTMLIAALHQEGHAFTEPRFDAWFAGLATLSDDPPRAARPPRVLCEAILTELAHSSWEPLAGLAARLPAALLAPRDHPDDEAAAATAHADANRIVATARDLLAQLRPASHPLAGLAHLHRGLGGHVLFAPPERGRVTVAIGARRLAVDRPPLPSPRWAAELLWGEYWRAAGLLPCALPFPGLVRLDTLRGAAADMRTIHAGALRDASDEHYRQLVRAAADARRIADLQPGQRSTSRAPALLELLAGFGPLRSAQIEALLGASRLGVRKILAALGESGVLERATLAGVHLFAVNLAAGRAEGPDALRSSLPGSSAALDEYEASMAAVEALLARRGGTARDGGSAG